jgi:hypothetical protein
MTADELRQLAFWCKRGHEMDEDNTIRGRRGEPECRQCLRIHLAAVRRWRASKTSPPTVGGEKRRTQ